MCFGKTGGVGRAELTTCAAAKATTLQIATILNVWCSIAKAINNKVWNRWYLNPQLKCASICFSPQHSSESN